MDSLACSVKLNSEGSFGYADLRGGRCVGQPINLNGHPASSLKVGQFGEGVRQNLTLFAYLGQFERRQGAFICNPDFDRAILVNRFHRYMAEAPSTLALAVPPAVVLE